MVWLSTSLEPKKRYKKTSALLFTSTFPINAGFIISKKAVEDIDKAKFDFFHMGKGPYEFVHWIFQKDTFRRKIRLVM